MQYRLRTLLLFIAACAVACGTVAQSRVLWLQAFAIAVPTMWSGLVLLLAGRALYNGDVEPAHQDALTAILGSVLVGAATVIIPFATALIALGLIAAMP